MFTLTVFKILLLEDLYYDPLSGSEGLRDLFIDNIV